MKNHHLPWIKMATTRHVWWLKRGWTYLLQQVGYENLKKEATAHSRHEVERVYARWLLVLISFMVFPFTDILIWVINVTQAEQLTSSGFLTTKLNMNQMASFKSRIISEKCVFFIENNIDFWKSYFFTSRKKNSYGIVQS